MDDDVDNMVAAYIQMVKIVIKGKGDVRHRPCADLALKSCCCQVVPGYLLHEDGRIVPDNPLVVEMKAAVQGVCIECKHCYRKDA